MSFNLAVILCESPRCAPDHPVAVFDGGQLTYRQLDQASDLCVPRIPSTALTSPPVMITGHVPAVHLPFHRAGAHVAAANPA
jgi:hypothetical protein